MKAMKILLGALIALMVLGSLAMADDVTVSATVRVGGTISAPSAATVTFDVGDNEVPMSADIGIASNGNTYLKAESSNTRFSGIPAPDWYKLGTPTVSGAYYGTGYLNSGNNFMYINSGGANLAETYGAQSVNIPIIFQQHVPVSVASGDAGTDTIQFTAQGA